MTNQAINYQHNTWELEIRSLEDPSRILATCTNYDALATLEMIQKGATLVRGWYDPEFEERVAKAREATFKRRREMLERVNAGRAARGEPPIVPPKHWVEEGTF